MFKVIYRLPINVIREILLSEEDLFAWLGKSWLRERIVSYEIIDRQKEEIWENN